MHKLIAIKESAHNAIWLYEALGYATRGDSIVLREEAVTGLHSKVLLASFLAKCAAQGISVYAVHEDLLRRGIQAQLQSVTLLKTDELPQLIQAHAKYIAW